MIPPFDGNGYLPPGLHKATLEEVQERFGASSEDRRTQMESLCWAVDLAKRIGAKRFIINGSFVTAKVHPIDVDCVVLVDRLLGSSEEKELEENIPFLTAYVVTPVVFERFTNQFFASDKLLVPKGMVELQW